MSGVQLQERGVCRNWLGKYKFFFGGGKAEKCPYAIIFRDKFDCTFKFISNAWLHTVQYSGMLRWCGGATILIDLIRPVLTPMQSRELPTAPPWCEY